MTHDREPRRPGRPRDPDLEARRKAEILAAAAGVFARAGFAAADVQEVADRLGVGKGTVYRYFPTKEALFLATVQTGLAELKADMDAVLADPDPDPLAVMRRSVLTYLEFFRRRPEMAELFIQERAAFRDRHVPLYFAADSDCEERHDRFFERLRAAGLIRPIPRERFFDVIGDLLYGTILTNLLTGRPADPAARADAVLDIVLHGVLARPGRPRRVRPKKLATGRKR